MIRSIAILLLALLPAMLGGCAQAPAPVATALATPVLRLPPSALPRPLALQQRLSFVHGERRDTVDAMVESDAGATRLVIHAQGQVALRLDWDGSRLRQQRAPWLPAALDGERVLSDLQLVYWPVAAISAALAPGWTLAEEGGGRTLRQGDTVVATVAYRGPLHVRLEQHVLGYALDIESREAQP